MSPAKSIVAASVLVLATSAPAFAAEYTLTIKDHMFSPSELTVPAGEDVTLLVKNQDSSPEEFESHDLRREKVIKGGSEATVKLGKLKAGTYKFVGEFHEDTAKGTIVAK